MSTIVVTSVKGSPGVTTCVMALAWVWPRVFPGRRVLVVDADRRRLLLIGLTSPRHLPPLATAWGRLADALRAQVGAEEEPVDALLDLGRLGTTGEPAALRDVADTVLVAVRPSIPSVAAARPLFEDLPEQRAWRPVILGDRGPYARQDVERALRVRVARQPGAAPGRECDRPRPRPGAARRGCRAAGQPAAAGPDERCRRPPLSVEEEYALAEAVMAALFGVGRLQPLLDDPSIENIEVNGHDQVWVSYADGREEAGPPVADSDAELVEQLQWLAARSGGAERTFTTATPPAALAAG